MSLFADFVGADKEKRELTDTSHHTWQQQVHTGCRDLLTVTQFYGKWSTRMRALVCPVPKPELFSTHFPLGMTV